MNQTALNPDDLERIDHSCLVDHNGSEIDIRGWRYKKSNLPPLVFVHDVGESIDMYRRAAQHMVRKGFSCYGFDLRGHGESGRVFTHVKRFETLVNDLLQISAWIKHIEGGRKPIVIGQGVGATVATYFLKDHASVVTGGILIAPIVRLPDKIQGWHKFFIHTLGELVPQMVTPKWLRPKLSNPQHREADDTLTSKIYEALIVRDMYPLSCGFTDQVIRAIERFDSTYAKVTAPHLIVLPDRDEILDYSNFAKVVGDNSSIAKLVVVENMSHNGFTESDETLERLSESLVEWIKGNLAEVK